MTMRNYEHFERYLDVLARDVYPQPPDKLHDKYAVEVIDNWLPHLRAARVLDVGCGQGSALAMLAKHADRVEGVTLGEDYTVCKEKGLPVREADMSFLPYGDGEFDVIYARHALEHSPMPLLTLMEWRRVARQWLVLVVPSLSSFEYYGRNHYYVLLPAQWLGLLERAGWKVIWAEDNDFEHRYCCERMTDDQIKLLEDQGGWLTHPKDA